MQLTDRETAITYLVQRCTDLGFFLSAVNLTDFLVHYQDAVAQHGTGFANQVASRYADQLQVSKRR